MTLPREDWYGCYAGGWQAAPLVAEAYAHPAKVSFTLADRIYRHMLAEGWLEPGDVVVDPFGGVGGFAFHAALYGMHWRGVELEQKFVDLGNQNIDLWRDRYAPHFPGYGSATLVQGDSRRLVEVVTGAAGVVTSPPFEGVVATQDPNFLTPGEQGKRIPSKSNMSDYGSTDGNLGNMPAGDVGAVITSPPYSETRIDGNGDEGASGLRDENGDYLRGAEGWEKRKALGARYGGDPGNLGNMPAGVVTSPPFEQTQKAQDVDFFCKVQATYRPNSGGTHPSSRGVYAPSEDNIGNNTADTFWSAAATIVAQCYDILRPGGYAAFVTGDFVRNKKRVPFGEQWLALCETCGFAPLLWAVAHKQEHLGVQTSLFGDDVELTKTKVSFFRRLANRNNPDAAITNEDVIFVRKPLTKEPQS